MSNTIYCDFYSKASEKEDETPCLKYSIKNEFTGAYEKFSLNEIQGTFIGAWPGIKKWEDTEEPIFNIKLAVGGKDHVIALKHYKPGYDMINMLASAEPNDNIIIKLNKRPGKDGKWWPDIKIGRIDSNEVIRGFPLTVEYKDYPKAKVVYNAAGNAVKDSKGKETMDYSEVIDFWNKIFESIINKFPKVSKSNTW